MVLSACVVDKFLFMPKPFLGVLIRVKLIRDPWKDFAHTGA